MLKRLHGGSDAASARKAADPLRPRVHASNTWEVRPAVRAWLPRPVLRLLAVCSLAFVTCHAHAAELIRVGPHREVRTIADAAHLAREGDTVEIDAGIYEGDTAVWARDRLSIRAVGGRVRLLANGAAAEGKAIWVIRGRDVVVRGIDFEGARVKDRNGAGIRFERGSLHVIDCSFMYNEMGLLTADDSGAQLTIENSEFAHNFRPDGHNHNLYVGAISWLLVQGSYFHHARTGHLLKSRAKSSRVVYNRISDETGSASYELEFPNGGLAYVIGNVIQQSVTTQNPQLISFGAEGYRWRRNALLLVNNTLIDEMPAGGIFVKAYPGSEPVRLLNNLLVGGGAVDLKERVEMLNRRAEKRSFANPAAFDYRIRPDTSIARTAVDPAALGAPELRPLREYAHPRSTKVVPSGPVLPGAMQSLAPGR